MYIRLTCAILCFMIYLISLCFAESIVCVQQETGLSIAKDNENLKININIPPEVHQSAPFYLMVLVVDHRDMSIMKQSRVIKPDSDTAIEIPFPVGRYGYFRVISYADKDGTKLFQSRTSCAIIPDVELKKPEPDSPFGIGAYYVVRFDPAELDIATQLQKRMGAAWNRDELLWDLCEPQQGQWNWERFDRSVKACRDNNILIMGLLDYWGKWTSPLTQKGYQDFAKYAQSMVKRFMSHGEFALSQQWHDDYGICHWEIWNEPATFFTGTGEQFGLLLKHTYEAIKRTDPNAHVFFANWGESFDLKVINTIGKEGFDGISPHYYCPPRSPEDGNIDIAMNQTVAFFHKQGIRKPFWITEIGWPSDDTLIRQNEQAQFLVRSYVLAFAAGMDKIFWYNFVNDGRDKANLEYGLINREDFSPKVGYAAYSAMVYRLLGAKFIEQVSTPRPLRAYIFKNGETSIAVIWSLKSEGELDINTRDSSLRLYDFMGNLKNPQHDSSGSVTIPLSPEPLYLESCMPTTDLSRCFAHADLRGIALLKLEILPLVGAIDNGTTVSVKVENYASQPVSGSLRIKAPSGWAIQKDTELFKQLPADGITVVHFCVASCERLPDNLYPIEITATTDDNNKMIAADVLSELVASFGSPEVDGNLDDWSQARWVYLNRESQAIGLQPYSDWNLSARVATMWNEKGFFFAAEVRDNDFYQPYSGDIVWQGDNFQLAFDTTLNRGIRPDHPAEYLYGLSLTTNGPEVFRWIGAGERPSLIPEATLRIVKSNDNRVLYECFLPAKLINPLKFEKNTQFGFSLILNDNDGGGRRGWLEWTPGIGTGYNSRYFTSWSLTR